MRFSCLLAFKTNREEDENNCEMLLELVRDIEQDQELFAGPDASVIVSVHIPSLAAQAVKSTTQKVLGVSCTRVSSDVFRGSVDSVKMWVKVCAGMFLTAGTRNIGCLSEMYNVMDKHLYSDTQQDIQPSEGTQMEGMSHTDHSSTLR